MSEFGHGLGGKAEVEAVAFGGDSSVAAFNELARLGSFVGWFQLRNGSGKCPNSDTPWIGRPGATQSPTGCETAGRAGACMGRSQVGSESAHSKRSRVLGLAPCFVTFDL